MKKYDRILAASLLLFLTCSVFGQVSKMANKHLLQDNALMNAHIGIAVYDPGEEKFIFSYQDNKYFVPASNTKIISCYAGMKLLGDSIPAIRYLESDTAIILFPTGDPTFLHRDYPVQPVADFIRSTTKRIWIDPSAWSDEPWGSGWSWDDYSEAYMAERSMLPIYGNVIRWYQVKTRKDNPGGPGDTADTFIYSEPEMDASIGFGKPEKNFRVHRNRDANVFTLYEGPERNAETEVPFVTQGLETALKLLPDTLHQQISVLPFPISNDRLLQSRTLYSRHLDSMLKPMMHRSDNFFAEQTLLMAGQQLTGQLQTASASEVIIKQLLSEMPDRPRWADGSGLSRYNLFTPRDFVWVLNRMHKEFSWGRISDIFPTGGKGTLRSYVADQGRLYAKTGTLSGVLALSGYIITRKNKTLIFSILINNHRQQTSVLRNKMAAFLRDIIEHY